MGGRDLKHVEAQITMKGIFTHILKIRYPGPLTLFKVYNVSLRYPVLESPVLEDRGSLTELSDYEEHD